MLKKFICWFWGHKLVHKKIVGYDRVGCEVYGEKVKSSFCLRCGKEII